MKLPQNGSLDMLVITGSVAIETTVGTSVVAITGTLPTAPAALIALLITCLSLSLCVVTCMVLMGRIIFAKWRTRFTGIPLRASRILGVSLMASGLVSHYLDATLYVRLYPLWHFGLASGGFLLTTGGVFFLFVTQLGRFHDDRRTATMPLVVVSILSLVVAHRCLMWREDAKASLLGNGVGLASIASVLSDISDVDRDGYGPLLTGSDSAPFNRRVQREPYCGVPIVSTASPPPATPARNRPSAAAIGNVVLIMVDALRYDHSFGGVGDHPFMPNVQRLASRSTIFTRAYTAASWTVPSFYSIMTGRWPWAVAWVPTGEQDNRLVIKGTPATWPRQWTSSVVPTLVADRHPTLAEAFEKAGWQSAIFPVQEYTSAVFGVTRGFTHYDDTIWHRFNGNGRGVTGAAQTRTALGFLESRPEKPLFMMLHYFDPHDPYQKPRGFEAAGDTPLDRYRAEVAYTDMQIGHLLYGLSKRGLLETTAVVLFGDHGESFGGHGGMTHGTSLYEEIIHIPLIIFLPGQPPRRIDDVVSLIDVAPTLIALAGLPPLTTFQGRNLVPLMEGKREPSRAVFSETVYKSIHEKYAIIADNYKLIWDAKGGYRELYHLLQDPNERSNRIEAEPDKARELTDKLCRTLKETARLNAAPITDIE